MVVQQINDDDAFREAIAVNSKSRVLVVCDFFANWCGPCRAIAPVLENLSERYAQKAVFLKIDVDRCRGVSQQYSIRAMPTFVVLLNGEEVGRIQGADPGGLEHMIATLADSRDVGSSGTSENIKKPQGDHVANAEERQWLERLVSHAERMSIYEDPLSQTLALSLIPADDLREKATNDGEVNQYELAKGLLAWFHGFFCWVNQAKCEKCGIDGKSDGHGDPTGEERQHGADRVELFRCEKCGDQIRFPRYNDPAKLLETRKGRCGEYANCFTLCCRAIGLQTRWISDNLDHVWVEVFSGQLQRWLHCDPCENVIDTPLMYDKGWGKKHAYVFAVAIDHVQDVTWRYHFDHRAVMNRRLSVRESVLRNFINVSH
uniref:Peptide-N(4)-(N-acetyl-beta-glucosaminyl)asparagine amidase n=1 Tax=Globodera pallida TaxID=36090 RepID=A0A183BL70_GLOPA